MEKILWHVEHIKKGSGRGTWDDNRFKITSAFRPSPRDMRQAQKSFGFDPKGYGNPYLVKQEKNEQGEWTTIFSCYGSCE